MNHNTIRLRKIENDKAGKQEYHISAVDEDGAVCFDSAFSNEDSIKNQLLTAVDEWLDGEE